MKILATRGKSCSLSDNVFLCPSTMYIGVDWIFMPKFYLPLSLALPKIAIFRNYCENCHFGSPREVGAMSRQSF